MRRIAFVTAAVFVMLVAGRTSISAFDPDEGEGQIPSCGSYGKSIDMLQTTDTRGHWTKGLEAYWETSRDNTPCGYSVRVEGQIEGVTGWGSDQRSGIVAWKWSSAPTPDFGTYTARGKHFVVWIGVASMDLGLTSKQVTQQIPTECPTEGEDAPEEVPQIWNDPNGSPLLFDMDHDGFRLTSMQDGVDFDIDADGVTDRVAWTELNSDDAWLALDRNGNGKIDNGGELFGNFTQARLPGSRAANGFEALTFLQADDVGFSGIDDVVDASDAVFSRLLLWRDRNHNGVSEKEELTSLSASPIARIGARYKTSTKRDDFGNAFKLLGGAEWKTGETFGFYDVYLTSSIDPSHGQ